MKRTKLNDELRWSHLELSTEGEEWSHVLNFHEMILNNGKKQQRSLLLDWAKHFREACDSNLFIDWRQKNNCFVSSQALSWRRNKWVETRCILKAKRTRTVMNYGTFCNTCYRVSALWVLLFAKYISTPSRLCFKLEPSFKALNECDL